MDHTKNQELAAHVAERLAELSTTTLTVTVSRNPRADAKYAVTVGDDDTHFCHTLPDVLMHLGKEIEAGLDMPDPDGSPMHLERVQPGREFTRKDGPRAGETLTLVSCELIGDQLSVSYQAPGVAIGVMSVPAGTVVWVKQ